jgi:hypothetical protein
MFFANLHTKQKEQSESVARFIVAGGKRRFLIRASLPAGIVPWLAMNLFFFARIRSEGIGGSFLAGLEVVTLLISSLFGILISLGMWKRFEQVAKSI